MGKTIDETGNRYGRWTVLYRNGSDSSYNAIWRCRCDCGTEKDIKGYYLRRGISRSCGCLQKDILAQRNRDEATHKIRVGDKSNHLTVLQVEDKRIFCQCDCGVKKWISRGNFTRGQKTCGCGIEQERNANFIDETGNRYGRLTVVEEKGRNKDRRVSWLCKCDCGNIKEVSGKSLRAGLVASCGCLSSKGEQKVQHILSELNINFETQKTFPDLKSDKNYYLFFDFYLLDYNILIEYQGEQHYRHSGETGWNTKEKFKDLQRRDNLKREYCKAHNIPLIEIPYTDFNKIDKNYILNLLGGKK